VPGNSITDFGAPDRQGPWDDEPLDQAEADRLTGLLEAGWRYLDSVVAGAPQGAARTPWDQQRETLAAALRAGLAHVQRWPGSCERKIHRPWFLSLR
jgi:hypothetical protein